MHNKNDILGLRDRYTDLLVKCLTNTIYEDPTMAPWAEKVFNRPTREIGGDWPRQAHSMVGTVRLNNLRSLMQACLDEGVPGDFIETGVWRGGCCILMRGVLAANSDTSRRVFVADSFKGLPQPKQISILQIVWISITLLKNFPFRWKT